LEARGRHAWRGAPVELERHGAAVGDHQPDAVEAEDVGDLVRVGDRGDRAVGDGEAGELRGHHHRTFDVDVRINEPGQEEAVVTRPRFGAQVGDAAAGDVQRGWDDAPAGHVHEVRGEGKGVHALARLPAEALAQVGELGEALGGGG